MGYKIDTLKPGDGETFPKKGDIVSVHYTGTLSNGDKFDASFDRGEPFKVKIGVGKVIKGWDEGVLKLSLGQKVILTVDPDCAYGAKGVPPLIPPNATLAFEMELLDIIN